MQAAKPMPADTADYEKNRINHLQEQRVYVQKKTFTKWMNSFLSKANMEVEDIFVDLSDGKKLLTLLQIISGERLPKPATGQMRVHRVENVHKCLIFLGEYMKIGNIGAEDIVDGNQKLILGLLWSIILRFHIKDIEVYTSESEEEQDEQQQNKRNDNYQQTPAKPKHSSKEALLLWCQKRIRGYKYVNVRDFTDSWRDGMAFNALIHTNRPDLVQYDQLDPDNHIDNLNSAFEIAREHLDIQPLIDAEDIATDKPIDELSMLTYVSSYYHKIANDGYSALEPRAEQSVRTESKSEVPEPQVKPTFVAPNEPLVESVLAKSVAPELEAISDQVDHALAETKVDQSSINEKPLTKKVEEAPVEEEHNWFLWVIVVAVSFTIIRNVFQNTARWFAGDAADNVEPHISNM